MPKAPTPPPKGGAQTEEARRRMRRQQAEAVLRRNPQHVGANLALAEVLASEGKVAEMLSALRRAADGSGGQEPVWARYVAALRSAGKKARARKAAAAAPLSRLARIAEGRAGVGPPPQPAKIAELLRAGRLRDARRAALDEIGRHPDDVTLRNILGVVELADGNAREAELVLLHANRLEPGRPEVVSNLGLALVRQGRMAEAIDLLEPQAGRNGATAELKANLASAYVRADRHADALALTRDLIEDGPEDGEIRALHVQALVGLERLDEAWAALEEVGDRPWFDLDDVAADVLDRRDGRAASLAYLDGRPDRPAATRLRIATLLSEWGELDRAAEMAKRLAEENPDDAEAFRLYSACRTWTASDPLLARLEGAAARDAQPPRRKGALFLTLGKARMDTGDDRGAFEALSAGNRALRSLVAFDVEKEASRLAGIARAWTPEAFGKAARTGGGPSPIFIVGLPRSGSTLIETILSRHPGVDVRGETPFVALAAERLQQDASPAGVEELLRATEAFLTPRGGLAATDKLLTNFMNLGALAAAYPNAIAVAALTSSKSSTGRRWPVSTSTSSSATSVGSAPASRG